MDTASRMRDLLSKFEAPRETPRAAPKERVQSSVDAPRPELSDQARRAQRNSASRVSHDVCKKRMVPRINAGDSDAVRELKRAIQAKEQEIMDMNTKLLALSERLERVVEIFTASIVETAQEEVPVKAPEDRVRAFRLEDVEETERNDPNETPKSSISAGKTSLAAILAAARNGTPRTKSATPKYSKLLADFK